MQQLWMPGKLFSTNLQCSVSVPNATTSVVGHASPEGCIALLGILVQSALVFEEQERAAIPSEPFAQRVEGDIIIARRPACRWEAILAP